MKMGVSGEVQTFTHKGACVAFACIACPPAVRAEFRFLGATAPQQVKFVARWSAQVKKFRWILNSLSQ
jgi:hypothetical protein